MVGNSSCVTLVVREGRTRSDLLLQETSDENLGPKLGRCSGRREDLSALPFRLCSHVAFNSVQWLSHVRLFATPWTAARQASLSITNSQSLLKLMSVKSVMPSNHLIHCRPLLLLPSVFPSIRVFSNESVLRTGGQSIEVAASAPHCPHSYLTSRRISKVNTSSAFPKYQGTY